MFPFPGATVDVPSALALFESAVRANPEAAAVSFDGHDLWSRQLHAAADGLARRLRAAGAGPKQVVGVALDRSADLIVAILGTLMSGAAYLPLDIAQPAERLRFILTDSGARWLVTAGACDDLEVPIGVVRLSCRADGDLETADAQTNALVDAAPDDLAYVMYTSGTTGQPKGVQVTHGNLAWFLSAYQRVLDYGPTDVWAQFHACTFDVSVSEIFGALSSGGRLVVVPADTARVPARMAALIDHERVSVLSQTPTAFVPLTNERTLRGESLRVVAMVGERLDPPRLSAWFARFPHWPRVVNVYGPTETSVFVTSRVITAADAQRATSPIGWPMAGASVVIADDGGRPVPDGDVGEIWIGGPCVTRGYVNRPELTADRFRALPGGGADHVMYRTGDRARRAPNGDIEFLGRFDDQVKIRGHRVEPAGVAAVLREQSGIRDAVVVAIDDANGPRLVGYVVPGEGVTFDEAALQALLAARLPAYMRCARILAIDRLPRSTSGKLDVRKLPRPEQRPAGGRAFVAPRTPTEVRVAALVAEVTGVESVGVEDEFFELGGHSLSAMRLAARLGEEFGGAVSPLLIFGAPRISALATAIEHRHAAGAEVDGPDFAR